MEAEMISGLADFQEVLANGSIAEVKAVLRAYIGRIDIDLRNNKARIGFYRLPTRVIGSRELEYEKVTINGVGMREPKPRGNTTRN
ncbi:hypothetical protein ACFL2A_01880 [Thermodesulfobacteriota bacterium]